MTRHLGERGPVYTAVRVFPADGTDGVAAFVTGTLGAAHPCSADAAALATTLAASARTGTAVVVAYADRWAYITLRPIGRTPAPAPPSGLGAGAGAKAVIAALERRATRWGLTREASTSAIWFELDAVTPDPAAGGRAARACAQAS